MEECYFCEEFEDEKTRPLSPLSDDDWICRECAEKKVKSRDIFRVNTAEWSYVAVAKPWVSVVETPRIVTNDITQLGVIDLEKFSFAIVREPINQKVEAAIVHPDEHQFEVKEVAQKAWEGRKALQFFFSKADQKGKVFFPGYNGLNGPEKIEEFLRDLVVLPHKWFVGVVYEAKGDEFFPPATQKKLFLEPDTSLKWFDTFDEMRKHTCSYEFIEY